MRLQQSQVEDRLPPECKKGDGCNRPGTTASELQQVISSAARGCSPPWHASLKGVLRRSCALDLLSRATARDRVEIFFYHGFCPGSRRDPRFPKLLPVELFEQHIRTYARYAQSLPLGQVLRPGAKGVVITFDDGYANNFELAFPVLQKYRFPATVFLTTGFLDRTTPLWTDWLEFLITAAPVRDTVFEWEGAPILLQLGGTASRTRVIAVLRDRLFHLSISEIHDFLRGLGAHLQVRYDWEATPDLLRPLEWDQVRAMRASGLVSFGSHTVSHPVLSRCATAVQQAEVLESRRRIEEELGEECMAFAYPYGKDPDYTEATKQVIKEAGFELALTAEPGSTRSSSFDHHEVKRWGAGIGVDDLAFLVSGGPLVSDCLRGRLWQ